MPTIPKYEGDVNVQSLPQERVPIGAPIEAFGGGEAISAGIQGLSNLVKIGRDNADKTAVIDAKNKLTELKNRILHGYEDDKKQKVVGALSEQGKNSFGLPEKVQKQYDEGVQKIYEGLNYRQKPMVQEADGETKNFILDSVYKHMDKEKNKYVANTIKTSADVYKNDAIANYADENQRLAALKNLRESYSMGTQIGMDDAMIKKAADDDVSSVHTSIVQRMLENGDDMQADEYYKKNYNEISGDDKLKVDKVLSGAKEDREVYAVHDKIIDMKVSEGQAKAKIREMYDNGEISAKVRKESTSMIEHTYLKKRDSKDASQKDINVAIANILDENGGDLSDPRLIKYKSLVTQDGRIGMAKYADFVKLGGRESDPIEYSDLKNRLLSKDADVRNSVTQAEITDNNFKITAAARKEFLNYFDLNKRNDEKFLKKSQDFVSDAEVIKTKIQAVGLDPKTAEGKLFESRARQEFEAAQSIQDKPLTKKQKNEIVDGLVKEDSLGFFGKMVKEGIGTGAAQMFGNYRFTDKVDDIPTDEMSKIKDSFLRKKGRLPTDGEALFMYNQKRNKQE
jgi:hypothetical protein